MVVGIKDIFKMIGIIIITFCAVFVCTLFMNYNLDLKEIDNIIEPGSMKIFYDAQIMTGKVVCALSGGCLLITSVVMLIFYIKRYIDSHGKELGILKALGYSNARIATGFWRFGLSVLIGTGLGFLASLCIMPKFYEVQNQDRLLPEIEIHVHFQLVCFLIIVPSIFFSVVAIGFAYLKLRKPVLQLLKGAVTVKVKRGKNEDSTEADLDIPFVKELQKSTFRQRKSLVFFIGFAAFCYSAMMQMSFSMDELASMMMSVMILGIGIVLACVTLFIAITTVINANTKTIAMMKVFGYSLKDCSKAILSGYRPVSYIGFAIGTIYQYVILKIAVTVIFKDMEGVPEYGFDFKALVIALVSFVILYEFVMYCYTRRIKRMSLKEIMSDGE